MQNFDQQWRDKIRAITSAMGVTGDAVYKEIEEAVEARIEQTRDDGWQSGMNQGTASCCNHYGD